MAVAGHDFWFMWALAQRAYVGACSDQWVSSTFSPALMIAISWEETQFNNIRQTPFNHDDWMKRWTDIDPSTNSPRKDATNQVSGNHAIGYVQVERDTIDRWLSLNPKICMGLPGFDADMLYSSNANVSGDLRAKRRRWWQTIDEKILASDDAGFQLGWRAFSHMHTAGVAGSKGAALKIYGGSNKARDNPDKKIGRTATQIVQGWLDTDACMRALANLSPYHVQNEFGWQYANAMLAGAYWFSRPDGDFASGFGTPNNTASRVARIFEKYLTRGSNDSFIETGKFDALRADIKTSLSITETA
jgi:hypothetical protein